MKCKMAADQVLKRFAPQIRKKDALHNLGYQPPDSGNNFKNDRRIRRYPSN